VVSKRVHSRGRDTRRSLSSASLAGARSRVHQTQRFCQDSPENSCPADGFPKPPVILGFNLRRRPTGWPRTRRRSSTPRRAQARRCATAVLFVATGAPKAGALSLKGKSLLKVLSMADFFQRQRHGCQRATQTTHARGPTRAARSRSATQAAARPAASRASAPPRAAPLARQASRAQPHFPYSPRLASGTRGRAHAGRRADATRGATARGCLRGRRIVEAVQAASWCSVCVHVPPDTSFVPPQVG
jgi:hypothetical protein